MNHYRRSLTPYPFVEGKNSASLYTASKWLAKCLDIIFWVLTGLFLILMFASLSSNFVWSLSLLMSAILICPLVPIHFAAKLALSAFASFPPSMALSMSVCLGLFWLVAVLRGPANDIDV